MKPKPSLPQLSVIILLLAMSYEPSAISQVPQGFNYQAIARDAVSGNPITDPVDIKIAILAGDASTVIREEQFPAVDPDEHGLFSLVVGQGAWVSGLANFSDIDWTVTPKYIRTSIYYDGGWKVLDPAQLWSVPYAYHSKSSGQWISTGNDIYRGSGKVGIGTTSPAYLLDVNGEITARSANSFRLRQNTYSTILRNDNNDFYLLLTNSGDPDGIWNSLRPFRINMGTGLVSIGNGALTVQNGGNVGIGSSTPSGKMVIQPSSSWSDELPLFEVKNKYGIPVLAVYNNGVRILIDHTYGKAVKGGFAIGGYDYTKAGSTIDLMTISPDSIRFNINNDNTKGPKGGFAIGGFDITSKSTINEDFMYITPQVSDNGYFNVFTGYQSGYKTVSPGIANAFYGYKSGFENTSGGVNTFIGNFSGLNNTTGSYNTAIGGLAGASLYTGSHNIFIGSNSGYDQSNPTKQGTGSTNVFIGNFAGKSYSTGYDNIFIGTNSGGKTTTGNNNVALGDAALWENTVGNANVAIGASAGYRSKGYNNIFLGNAAGYYEEGSHRLYIDNFAYSAPNAFIYGELDNHFLRINATVEIKSGVAPYINFYETDADKNWYLGGDGGEFWLGETNTNSANRRITVVAGGNVGIGTTSPGYKLQVGNAGDGTQARANAWNTLSDGSLKTGLIRPDDPLEMVKGINAYFYYWKNGFDKTRQFGLISQEVEKVLPEIVSRGDDGLLSLDYGKVTPLLVECIKEQQQQIEAQQAQINQLSSLIIEMKSEIASLRSQ